MELTNGEVLRTTKTPVINYNLYKEVFADKLVQEKNRVSIDFEKLLMILGNIAYSVIVVLMCADIFL